MPYIIAELSANHGGSIESAKLAINAAKESGASAVKISGNVEKGGTGATVKDMATGNVGTVPGNKKAPALTSVAAPKKAE